MGAEEISSLLGALDINTFPSVRKFLFIEELSNADGSFIIGSVIKDHIEKGKNVILILCHNNIGHFHCIGKKLGYDLFSLRSSGEVFVVEILEKIAYHNFINDEESLKNLYFDIKKQIQEWNEEKGVCIIVESVGNLLLANINNVLNFVQYLRETVHEKGNSTLVCSLHNFSDLNFNTVTKALKHVADTVVTLKDLSTGRANDVTGHLTVTIRDEKFVKTTTEYHYLLEDKKIHVFPPGSHEFFIKK